MADSRMDINQNSRERNASSFAWNRVQGQRVCQLDLAREKVLGTEGLSRTIFVEPGEKISDFMSPSNRRSHSQAGHCIRCVECRFCLTESFTGIEMEPQGE